VRARDLSAPPPATVRKRPIPKRLRKAAIFQQLGPGLITGAADDEIKKRVHPVRVGASAEINSPTTKLLWPAVSLDSFTENGGGGG
jgi:hypothetical protein